MKENTTRIVLDTNLGLYFQVQTQILTASLGGLNMVWTQEDVSQQDN